MFCKNCGFQIPDNDVFCQNCGTRVNNIPLDTGTKTPPHIPTVTPAMETPAKKKKKGLIVAVAVIVALIGVAITVVVSYFSGTNYKIIHALDDKEYEKAIDIYENEADGEASNSLVSSLRDKISSIKNDFADEKIEYTVAKMEITAIKEMSIYDLNEDVKSALRFFDTVNASRSAFKTAESLFEQGDYAGAIRKYGEVIEDDSQNYESAKKKLVQATENYREKKIKLAGDYITNSNNYSAAITELENALAVLPNDAKISEQLEIYKSDYKNVTKEEALKKAASEADSNNYEKAINILLDEKENNTDDAEIQIKLDEYSTLYESIVVSEAEKLISEKKYEDAIDILEQALELLPDNVKLSEIKQTAENKKPVALDTLKAVNSGYGFKWNEGNPVDPFGETHEQGCNYAIINPVSAAYVEYKLAGKYNKLTGSLVPHDNIPEYAYAQLRIYADDELVYTSPNIERKTDIFYFEVDIHGAKYVKLKLDGTDSSKNCVILSNVQLWTE